MSVSADILRSYRAPVQVVAGFLRQGPREDRALMLLMLAAFLLFVSQLPEVWRLGGLDDTVPVEGRLAGALAASFFFLPLVCYGIAALSHLLLRAVGLPSTWFGARLALFWALLASAPLALLRGAVGAVTGPGTVAALVGLAVFAAFAAIWIAGLRAMVHDARAAI
jgi:hypothetical protein